MAILRAYHRSLLKAALKWACVCLIFFVIPLHVSVKFWLGPAYVAMQVEQELSEFWAGPVRAEEVEFNYDGVMFIREMGFHDQSGAEIMKASDIKLVLGNWPSLTASAKSIKVEHLDVWLRPKDGKLNLPVRTEQNSDAGLSDIEYMNIESITVRVECGKSEAIFDRLFADVARAEGLYKLSIGNNKVNDSYLIDINGVFDLARGDTNIGLKFAQKTTPEEMNVFLSAMGIPEKWSCDGKIDAELKVKGKFSDTESLWPEGIAKLEDWTILENQHVVFSEVRGVLNVANRRLDLKKLKGVFCEGSFAGAFYLDIRQSGPIAYGGDIRLRKINMAELTELAEASKKLTKGTGFLKIQFHGDVNAPDDIRAYGSVFIDDADLWQVPVIGGLFKNFGSWEYKIAGVSDAEAVFRLWGPRMTIERGHLSNSFSAIEVEQGGQINLKTGQVDMYAVGIPLKGLEKIIGEIPVANWFMHLKDKLVRLQIKGNWSEPASKLIHKRPIKDVKEATLGFLGDMAKSGGGITDELKKALGFEQDGNEPEVEQRENR